MNYSHGLRNHKLYHVWCTIKQRCSNYKTTGFKNWGGRGIIMCDEWKNSFQVFYDFCISDGWKEWLQIDRINNDGNYEPLNCRLVTKEVQSRNTRSNHLLTYNNQTHCIVEWAEITGIKKYNIFNRINKYKWTIEKTLTKFK